MDQPFPAWHGSHAMRRIWIWIRLCIRTHLLLDPTSVPATALPAESRCRKMRVASAELTVIVTARRAKGTGKASLTFPSPPNPVQVRACVRAACIFPRFFYIFIFLYFSIFLLSTFYFLPSIFYFPFSIFYFFFIFNLSIKGSAAIGGDKYAF